MLDYFLSNEIIKSEKRRLEVFMGVLFVGFMATLVVRVFHFDQLQSTFKNEQSYYLLMLSILLMMVFVFSARLWVIQVMRAGERLTKRYYGLTVIMEVFVPSFWLVMIAINEQSAGFLDSPLIFVYFILLIVSSMHLSFWFSAMMGLMIALFYAVYTFWVTTIFPINHDLPVFVFYVRAGVYLVAGICAGLVASELKNRLTATHRNLLEKEEIEGLFSQQVSKRLVDVLKEKGDYTARVVATVLFLDIRNFTQKVQHLSPEEVNAFQNKFFGPIIEIINENSGIVNQIMGDGLMATFGAPVIDEVHYQCAWKTVNDIFSYVERFRNDNDEHRSIEIGIGMHSGEVLVGNIGTELRKQLSVSGKTVIIASRIEQFNKELESTLLMSGVLYKYLKDEIGEYKSMSKYKLKGIDEEVTIVQII